MINQHVSISESSHDRCMQTMHQIMDPSVSQRWLDDWSKQRGRV